MTARDTVTVGVEEEFHLAEPARRGLAPADPPPRPELVRAARWRAARSGCPACWSTRGGPRALPAREVVGALLEHVRPALDELGDTDRVVAGVEALVRRGTAADRQRAVYARRERLADVVDALVAETRAGL